MQKQQAYNFRGGPSYERTNAGIVYFMNTIFDIHNNGTYISSLRVPERQPCKNVDIPIKLNAAEETGPLSLQ